MSTIRFETHEDGTPEWYNDDLQLLVQIDKNGAVLAFQKDGDWYNEIDTDTIRVLAEMINEADEHAHFVGNGRK